MTFIGSKIVQKKLRILNTLPEGGLTHEYSRSRFAEPREGEGVAYPTAALLRSLQWVSDRYVSLQDTALIGVLLW